MFAPGTMPCMDSGAVAGLIGASVGAAGALIAARITGRLGSRGQHAQARQQARRETYIAFLHGVMEFEDAFIPVKVAATHGDDSTLAASVSALTSKYEAVRRAEAAVGIEGPDEVRGAAAATVVAVRGVLYEVSENARAASTSNLIRHVVTARNGFEHKAALVLDSPEHISNHRYPVQLRP